jgi:hypothetical protein
MKMQWNGYWSVEYSILGCEWARFYSKDEAMEYAKENATVAAEGGGHLDVWYVAQRLGPLN